MNDTLAAAASLPPSIALMQQLMQRIEALEKRVEQLEARTHDHHGVTNAGQPYMIEGSRDDVVY